MKKLLLIAMSIVLIAACKKEDIETNNICPKLSNSEVPTAVKAAFQEKNPGTTVIQWFDKDNFAYAAYYKENSQNRLAYFESDGEYIITVADTDNDGEFDEEWEDDDFDDFDCDDFEEEELKEIVLECLEVYLLEIEEWHLEISEEIEWLEAHLDTATCNQTELLEELEMLEEEAEEAEFEYLELTELIEFIESCNVNHEELCELFYECEEEECGCDDDCHHHDDDDDDEWEDDEDGCECHIDE